VRHEVLVLGSGPAGAAVARRLASSGVHVAFVGSGQRAGWEGVSDRSRALLAEEGIEPGELAGPFLRRGTWADRRVEGQEWLVERVRLAVALRERAISAGAVARAAVVTGVMREGGEWRIVTRGGDTLSAPVLVEARGRRGPARRGPLLMSLSHEYRRQPRGEDGTHIEAADFGWCWWAERGERLWVQVVARPRQDPPAGWTAMAARQIPALARALNGAVPEGEPSACAAHARLGMDRRNLIAERGSRPWRVGDAAVALDPLSGQGIYQSLESARLVAAAVNSVLAGGDAALAQRFISERHEEAFDRGVRIAAEFYGVNRSRGGFWAETADAYDAASRSTRRTAAEPRVERRIERRPVLADGRIVERDLIVSDAHPRGVWHVAGVPLAELSRYLDANAGATPASVARGLGRPDRAVAAAMDWLNEATRIHAGG
jgi:flavin-dependent dehydrogenase